MIDIELIESVVINAIKDLNNCLLEGKKLEHLKSTVLLGKDGKLDSLGLVNLLVIIEQSIEDEFDKNITIADERAMSQKSSPFKTVNTLINYIHKVLKEIDENV